MSEDLKTELARLRKQTETIKRLEETVRTLKIQRNEAQYAARVMWNMLRLLSGVFAVTKIEEMGVRWSWLEQEE